MFNFAAPALPSPCPGFYAHSLGHYKAACTYFKAVLASDAIPLHDTALLAAALAELQVCPAVDLLWLDCGASAAGS